MTSDIGKVEGQTDAQVSDLEAPKKKSLSELVYFRVHSCLERNEIGDFRFRVFLNAAICLVSEVQSAGESTPSRKET